MKAKKSILFIMGVSGSGKTTIGRLLANELEIPFFDGDDYHPKENVEKMSKGIALNDFDRVEWLRRLNTLALEHKDLGAVIACSALKKKYRVELGKNLDGKTKFIYLEGTFEEIAQRLNERKGHFMPPGLLKSQFATLEVPKNAVSVSINGAPEKIISTLLKKLIDSGK